jgi:hypothetical protein
MSEDLNGIVVLTAMIKAIIAGSDYPCWLSLYENLLMSLLTQSLLCTRNSMEVQIFECYLNYLRTWTKQLGYNTFLGKTQCIRLRPFQSIRLCREVRTRLPNPKCRDVTRRYS